MDSLISFTVVHGRKLLAALESSYKKRSYQDQFFKLRPDGSATPHFFDPLVVARFPFMWSSFITPSPQVVLRDFSSKEKSHVDILKNLSSNL